MLKHYSHIRMEAKRRAVLALAKKPEAPAAPASDRDVPPKDSPKVEVLN
jgi:hypothetical protein